MEFSMIRLCKACGAKNRVSAQHLADTGRCGSCKAPLPPRRRTVGRGCRLVRRYCAGDPRAGNGGFLGGVVRAVPFRRSRGSRARGRNGWTGACLESGYGKKSGTSKPIPGTRHSELCSTERRQNGVSAGGSCAARADAALARDGQFFSRLAGHARPKRGWRNGLQPEEPSGFFRRECRRCRHVPVCRRR